MRLSLVFFVIPLLFVACGGDASIRPDLPPNASDLNLLGSTALCDAEMAFTQLRAKAQPKREAWGTGSEYRIESDRSASKGDESYFFDQDGLLVGALFTFPSGVDLKPYPVLRKTLNELKPAFEFYMDVANVASSGTLDTSALYKTGEEKTTTQYLVLGGPDRPTLLAASFALDPYEPLMSPYREEFLRRVPGGSKGSGKLEARGSKDKEPFALLQQFARGEVAQLAYCGNQNPEVAVDAYRKAIATGITNKARLADAHHKFGMALLLNGQPEQARIELERSLTIRPNVKEVYNNLGTIYKQLGQREKAMAAFEKAVTLSPNYPIARFNLAEAYEESNPRLAISEYETYLVLAQGYPEEEARIAQAKERVKKLKHQ